LKSRRTAALLLLLCSCQSPIRSSSTPESPERLPDVGHPLIYVSNEESNDITVIDGSTDTAVANLFVGKRPRGLKLSPDGKNLFVALSGSPMSPPGSDESKLPPPDRAADGIAIVDLASGRVVRTLSTGDDPESFDITQDGRLMFVSNEDAATATAVALPSGHVERVIPVGGEPEGVRIRPDGKFVYVTSEADNEVAAIDLASQKVIARIGTGPRPRGIAFTPDGSRAYVTAEQGASVTVIDATQHRAIGEIPIAASGAKPMGIAISADGRTAYVSCGRGGVIAVIDVKTNRVVRVFSGIGVRPWGIGLAPDQRKLYTANGPSNDVSVVDVSSGTVLKRIPAGKGPWGVVISAQGL
jgi:YVTN family beta-propeller protein